jgi:hypothetical protein
MSKWALVVVACCMAAGTAAAGPKISTSDVNSSRELRAGAVEVIAHDLSTKLASSACDRCRVDASVTRLVAENTDAGIVVTADLSFTVTDDQGLVISLVASCSHAVARKAKLVTLRNDALHGAIASATPKVTRALAQPGQVARR